MESGDGVRYCILPDSATLHPGYKLKSAERDELIKERSPDEMQWNPGMVSGVAFSRIPLRCIRATNFRLEPCVLNLIPVFFIDKSSCDAISS